MKRNRYVDIDAPHVVEMRGLIGLVALFVVGVIAFALTGCAGAQNPALSPIPPHVVEREGYGTCAETGGKIEVPSAGAVALLTSICWLRADAGVTAIDASAPAFVEGKGDAGAGDVEVSE